MAMEDPESRWDLYEHLKVLWQTFGLVSALMVSACITSLNSDVSNLNDSERQTFGCMWSAYLMVNIAALMFSIVNLGLVLRLRKNEEVGREFSWDIGRGLVYMQTMFPSLCTVAGALLFTAACIVTACQKFGTATCTVAACIGLLTVALGFCILVSVAISDKCRPRDPPAGVAPPARALTPPPSSSNPCLSPCPISQSSSAVAAFSPAPQSSDGPGTHNVQ